MNSPSVPTVFFGSGSALTDLLLIGIPMFMRWRTESIAWLSPGAAEALMVIMGMTSNIAERQLELRHLLIAKKHDPQTKVSGPSGVGWSMSVP